MANSIYKGKVVDRTDSVYTTLWSTYVRQPNGSYTYLADGSGYSRAYGKKIDYTYRVWYTYGGEGTWREFRAKNGYLPTQYTNELKEFVEFSAAVPVYYAYGGAYRVDMKTSDSVFIHRLSGISWSPPYFKQLFELASMRDDAKQKVLSRIRDQKVHLPVMFAEGRETVRMIAERVQTLGKAYRYFQRGQFRRAAKELRLPYDFITRRSRTAASHWLEYSLGWMPVLQDVKGLIQLAEKGLLNPERGPRFRATSSCYDKLDYSVMQNDQGASNLPYGQTSIKGSTYITVKAGLLVEYKPTASGLNSVGLGAFDPLTTAWELIPFSFVFDYFVDVGGYLESLSSLQDVVVLAGFESIIQQSLGRATMEKPQDSGWIDGLKPYADYSWRLYRRYNWLGNVSLRKPLIDGLNARRITTMAALWRQLTRGDRIVGNYRP